jgi:hypothetical protein
MIDTRICRKELQRIAFHERYPCYARGRRSPVFIDITMRFRTILTSGIALVLPLLDQAAGKWDCPTEKFHLRFYEKEQGKYLIKYRGKNTTNTDNPDEVVDKTMSWLTHDEEAGGNGTYKFGGLPIEREDILNEHPFEIHISERTDKGEVVPEVNGQSLKVCHLSEMRYSFPLTIECVLKMAEDPCVLRLSWYLGYGLDIEGEELAESRPVKGADSMRITCKGDLDVWDWSVLMAKSP